MIAKWRRRAKIGQRRDPGLAGMGRIRDRCVHWIVFVAETRILAPADVKTKFASVITLEEICRVLLGTRLDLRKKVKNATKNKAHIAACKGIRKLKRSNAACKIEGVIGDLRETACPKKTLNAPQQELKVIIRTPSEFITRKEMSMFKATNMIKYGTVRSFLSN